jgi:dihydroorotase-like cyclic amidohydrolase
LKQKLKLDADADFVFFDQRQTRVITRHSDTTKCEEID